MEVRINLNKKVKFKLSERGKEIYRHRYDGCGFEYDREPKLDNDGYMSMQLWTFMWIFGEHMNMGMHEVVQPLEIIYEQEDEYEFKSTTKEAFNLVIEALQEPTLVRCKDCKWWSGSVNTSHNNHLCKRALDQNVEYWTRGDDYCSYGTPKEMTLEEWQGLDREIQGDAKTATPTEDCISRQAAIDALQNPDGYTDLGTDDLFLSMGMAVKRVLSLSPVEPSDKDAISRESLLKSWEELSPRGRTEFDQVIMTIPALPPVTPKERTGEWIPMSERLPSEDDDYLCTIPLDAYETYTEVLTFHKGRFYEDDDEWGATYHDDVIAWMPLPEPYKDGDMEW